MKEVLNVGARYLVVGPSHGNSCFHAELLELRLYLSRHLKGFLY